MHEYNYNVYVTDPFFFLLKNIQIYIKIFIFLFINKKIPKNQAERLNFFF